MTALTSTIDLTVVTCWCGLGHAVPHSLYREAHKTGRTLYCPLGHGYSWSSENDELRKQATVLRSRLADADARLTHARDDADHQRKLAGTARRQAAARKGQLTQAFNRLRAGVCPLCRRNFPSLGEHMRHEHPTAVEDVEKEPLPAGKE